MKKPSISLIVRIIVSAALVMLLLYIMRGKYGEVLLVLKDTNPMLFFAALLLFMVAISISSLRLKLIIDAQGSIKVSFFETISLTFIGYFFNNFLPTAIGGDVVKAYYLSRKSTEKTPSFTSVFVDRAIGLLTMIFMAFVALFFVDNRVLDEGIKSSIVLIAAVSAIVIVFMMNRRIAQKFSAALFLVRPLEDKLRKVYNAVNKYRNHNLLMFQSFVISALSQLLFFFSIGVIAFSVGARISVLNVLLRMPIISMMSLLPSINGLGLREGSTVLLFGPLIGKEKAFAVSILWLFLLLVISLVGGAIYGLSPQFRVKLKEAEKVKGAI
jgi:hypothetical protein